MAPTEVIVTLQKPTKSTRLVRWPGLPAGLLSLLSPRHVVAP